MSASGARPAGGVEPGETLVAAAHRETLEEAGLPIELEGILRVEHTPGPDHCRVRVIYLARPADDTPPKSEPDSESLEARWFRLDELDTVALRSDSVAALLAGVAGGADVWPLALIRSE